MKLPPDQLKLRLEAALRTLERITEGLYVSEDAQVAVAHAEWHLRHELALLTEQQRPR